MEESVSIDADFVQIARLASQGAAADARLYLGRLIRKYRKTLPLLATQLDEILRQTPQPRGGMLRRSETERLPALVPPPLDADSQLALMRIVDDRAGLEAPLLPDVLRMQLEAIVDERRAAATLRERGLSPSRSAILVGPPGVGKTLSARWIASQLDRPLWVLDLSSVMSSLLGKTGSNLRAVFDHARQNDAVLLLDEIDAIAKRRNDETDIGELKRLVTVILQEVDPWPDNSLLLAATNHPELVDRALWRRFDVVLSFDQPDHAGICQAIIRFFGGDAALVSASIPAMALALRKEPLALIERHIQRIRRAIAMERGSPADVLNEFFEHLQIEMTHAERLLFADALLQSGQYSQHHVKRLSGVARDTLRKRVRAAPAKRKGA